MDINPRPHVILLISLDEGMSACLHFADATLSNPFSNQDDGIREVEVAEKERPEVTPAQAETLKQLMRTYSFVRHAGTAEKRPENIVIHENGKWELEKDFISSNLPEGYGDMLVRSGWNRHIIN